MVRENRSRLAGHFLDEKKLKSKVEENFRKLKEKCSISQYICILKLIQGRHLNVFYNPLQKGTGNLRCNSGTPNELVDGFATLSDGMGQIIIDLLYDDKIMFEQLFPGVKRDDKLVSTAASIRNLVINKELAKLVVPADQFQSTTSLMSNCKAVTTCLLLVGSVVCVAILESMSMERQGYEK